MVKAMKTTTDAASTRSEIERTYRDRGGGFLAWARAHAPDFATAEDILQDAFLKALANASALSIVEDLAGWIFAAMRNRLADLWRGKAARRRAGATDVPDETLVQIAAVAGFDPQDEFVRGELAGAIKMAIDALPALQREVLMAQTVEGVTFRELSERTGTSIDTLMARKRYAVKKLAAALIEWVDFE
jgi:RNA polymerase sigma factor (sigma-70 family)